tara:strand:- start:586 stop:882 length:297 start_codon:yes stop_codon:yes gene_type:complete
MNKYLKSLRNLILYLIILIISIVSFYFILTFFYIGSTNVIDAPILGAQGALILSPLLLICILIFDKKTRDLKFFFKYIILIPLISALIAILIGFLNTQ